MIKIEIEIDDRLYADFAQMVEDRAEECRNIRMKLGESPNQCGNPHTLSSEIEGSMAKELAAQAITRIQKFTR